jgi:hypothetical protein
VIKVNDTTTIYVNSQRYDVDCKESIHCKEILSIAGFSNIPPDKLLIIDELTKQKYCSNSSIKIRDNISLIVSIN